jgi:hypothetical protein
MVFRHFTLRIGNKKASIQGQKLDGAVLENMQQQVSVSIVFQQLIKRLNIKDDNKRSKLKSDNKSNNIPSLAKLTEPNQQIHFPFFHIIIFNNFKRLSLFLFKNSVFLFD